MNTANSTSESPAATATPTAPTNPHRELQREMEKLTVGRPVMLDTGNGGKVAAGRPGVTMRSSARASRHSIGKADRKRARKAKWDRGETKATT